MNNFKDKILNKAHKIFDRFLGGLDNRSIEVLVDEELKNFLNVNKKTILYVANKYDYGKKEWGLSYEYHNFYHTLLNMDYSIICFDYDRIKQKYGNRKMSQMLHQAVLYYHPDVLFYVHFHDWIDHAVLKETSCKLPTKTIIWLTDDQWQYEETRSVWQLFNLVITTDRKGYERRKRGF